MGEGPRLADVFPLPLGNGRTCRTECTLGRTRRDVREDEGTDCAPFRDPLLRYTQF